MIGTLADYPLLRVTVDGTNYFVDENKHTVFLDVPKLPEVTDKEIIDTVLEAAGAVS